MRRNLKTCILLFVFLVSLIPTNFITAVPENLWVINSKEFIWKDAVNDQGHQKDAWLPGGTSQHFDISEFRVTSDGDSLYFLVRFANMSNIKLGDNGATFLAIAIDYQNGGEAWLSGMSGLQVNGDAKWEYQLVVNLADPNYSGQDFAVTSPQGNWGKIFYIVDSSWSQLDIPNALMAVNTSNSIIEIKLPKDLFGGVLPGNLKITVMTAPGWSDGDGQGGVWGEAFDFVSDKTSDDEKADGIVDYYLPIALADITTHSSITIDGNPNDWIGEFVLPKPELSVRISADKTEIERYESAILTVTVENSGDVDAENVAVHLLLNDELIKEWTVNVSSKGSVSLTYEWKPSATGTYEFKAIVDPDNLIEEVDEGNNVATVTIEVGKIEIAQRNFVNLATYIWPKLYEKRYAETLTLLKSISEAKLPLRYQENLTEFYEQLNLSREKFGKGEALMSEAHSQFSGATKIFSAYSGLVRLQREINAFMKAVEGELLETKLTKAIDGDLSDWGLETLIYEDTTGFGQDGANLKALYVDYDDSFLYIALTTENKASWRIAYGFALDYKDGGYTTGTDAWGRKISFTKGVDAELYFWWFGEFFGEKGTDSIETMQLTVWNGEGWEYYNLEDIGFAAWTGKEKGLQTLEIAVPWDMLGGKPGKIAIVAWITGASAGDSAVETLPDNPSIHDLDMGQEWTDEDTITVFAEVEIS